jgi:uncharacterized membrane protein
VFYKSDQFVFLSLMFITVFWTVLFFLYCCAKLASLRYTMVDTGVVESALWNTLQGRVLESTISRGSFLNVHFSPSLILLVPLYAIGQSTEWLFLLQTLAIAAGAPLIYLFAKYAGIVRWHSFLLGVVWLFCAPIIGLATFDFHEVSITGWLLILTALLAVKGKTFPVLILASVLLGIKEDVGIYVCSLGLILILGYRKSRIGWMLVGISLVYFVIVYFWLWSALYPNRVRLETDRFAQFGIQGNIVGALLSNPLLLIEPLLRWDRLWALGMLLLPLALLPLWHRAMLGVLPSLWVFLSLSVFGWGIFNMHYHAPILALLFLAAIPAMIWLRKNLPVAYKTSIAALIPLTLLMHFTIPPEFAWGIYNPASIKPHPSINVLHKVFSASSSQSIATDVLAGSAETLRPNLYAFPCSYLPDIICSKNALSTPFTLVFIKSLGYGLERPDPVFLILSRHAKGNADEYLMQRLRWIEAEESDAVSWDMRSLHGATGGRALYIAQDYSWSDRFLAFREEMLPAGNYHMGVRLALGRKGSGENVTFSVMTKGKQGESQGIALLDIGMNEMDKDILKAYWIDFTLEKESNVQPLLHFGQKGEYWVDGVELKGLDPDFNSYFNSICKATLKASDAVLTPSNSGIRNPLDSDGMLRLQNGQDEYLSLKWQVPPSLKPGSYFLCLHMGMESLEHAQIPWADLYAVNSGKYQKITSLFYNDFQNNNISERLQLCRVAIPLCDEIVLDIKKPKNVSLMFDQMIFCFMP